MEMHQMKRHGDLPEAQAASVSAEPIGEVVISEEGAVKGWTVIRWRADLPPVPVGMKLYAAPQPLTRAAQDVLAERRQPVEAEGWMPAHGEMAEAAASYAYHATNRKGYPAGHPPVSWPWAPEWWKPGDPRHMLVKAGALILAELERLDRASDSQR